MLYRDNTCSFVYMQDLSKVLKEGSAQRKIESMSYMSKEIARKITTPLDLTLQLTRSVIEQPNAATSATHLQAILFGL